MTDERELAEVALARLTTGDDVETIEWPPVARRVRGAREKLGLSEADIAARLGISPSESWDIEVHDDETFDVFSLALVRQLAAILGISLDALLFGASFERSVNRMPYAVMAERLAALAASEGLTIEKLSDRVGWDLTPVLADPELLGQFNVVGLRDVCRAVGVDWVSALLRPKQPTA